MSNTLKSRVASLLKDTFVWDLRERKRDNALVAAWLQAGKPVPPPEFVKRVTLGEYAAAFGLKTFIETGTFMGGSLYALKRRFNDLYSIELSPELAAQAIKRFRKAPHIHILQGDSAAVLPQLLSEISTPCLFWLDGHFSGGITARADMDTPIVKELLTVFGHPCKTHVILIDDARLFDGTHDYPTIDGLRDLVAKERPDYEFSLVNDIIRIHLPKAVRTTY